jgi:twitching motility protein PilT
MIDLNNILTVAIKGGASDIHIKAGLPPMFRVNGSLLPLKEAQRLTPEEIAKTALAIMSPAQQQTLKDRLDCDFAYGVPGVGRFRVNVFMQRGATGMVLRVIPYKIQTIDGLLLPNVVKKVADNHRGLILVTGTTGSGKSTTLAAIIDHINSTRNAHIITVEDPIEFLMRDKRSVINQREVGADCVSFGSALRAALRQDPDVILMGEMRDMETIEIALTAAETGHLVLSTLHTTDAAETVTRIVTSFPPHQRSQIRLQFAGIIKGVISQRLVPKRDGRGRVAAVEVMVSTARIKELIMDETKSRDLHETIAKGRETYGMQTFDQSLMSLLQQGLITYEEAMLQASNPDDFALRVSGVEEAGAGWAPDPRRGGDRNDNNEFDLSDF